MLAEISRLDLQELSTSSGASITDVKHLSSYNWLEAPTPTIAVPGSPPLWAPPRVPRQLKKDSGLFYIAQNSARHPDSPLEPLFRALYLTNPSFDIHSIHVVTDRNNIRKLLSFIDPRSARGGLEAFTINIEVVKNTVIFCLSDTVTHEYIEPREFRGFGHEFEKVYTANQISLSTGHHRIISYRFSDLTFLVRHETDGYVHAGIDTNKPRGSEEPEPENDNLPSFLESLSLSSTKAPSKITPAGKSKLTVIEQGKAVPLESTIEIKTRVSHRLLVMDEIVPQLWVSQTPKLVRAYHTKGTFQRPEVEDMAGEIRIWEAGNQSNLKKLAALIHTIIDVVKGCGGHAVVNYDIKGDKLVVLQVEGRRMLPEDFKVAWRDTLCGKTNEGYFNF
ncbi:uncharacterized protein BDR25DRAFT_324271 [Lindgomyces ingoldianus]|uniref:Uncharacterized protein n=1 Tax=Lindgomyces ingoldianus TaxID=673940 RepID=A0ACB6R1W4_9PLEO|nr:uncharacterized protein BDR25DRAFT_324271 [Lindgomyces ingoldianus]KAF2472327.1 hypothetical protein BDR25DRAFT_324271 [Lindgomyces ingoldianus]